MNTQRKIAVSITACVLFACFPCGRATAGDIPEPGFPFSLWKLYRNLDDPLLVRAMLLAGAQTVERSGPWEDRWMDNVLSLVTTAEAARILIEAGAEVNQPNILMQAQNGDVVEVLLAAGAEVHAGDEDGFGPFARETLLHTAPDAKAARLLLEAGLPVEGKPPVEKEDFSLFGSSSTYYTPLCCARNAGVTRVLLAAGADPCFRAEDNMTPLHFAPDAESVRLLLEAGADAKAESDTGLTPLHDVRDAQSARLLLAAGADVNAEAAVRGAFSGDGESHIWLTPLASVLTGSWYPENSRNLPIMRVLIEAGANVNVVDKDGRSLLMFADTPEMAELLINAGADVSARDKDGRSPLEYARSVEMVRLLIAAGADPLATWENPLFHVCDLPTAELYLGLLGDAGRDVKAMLNARDERDDTPLMVAVSRRNVKPEGFMSFDPPRFSDYVMDKDLPEEICGEGGPENADVPAIIHRMQSRDLLTLARLFEAAGAKITADDAQELLDYVRKPETLRWLIAAGADVNKVDADGETLLHRMIYAGVPAQTIRILLEAGAEVDACDLRGNTPLLTLAGRTGGWESRFTDFPAITRMLIDAGADVRAKVTWQRLPEMEPLFRGRFSEGEAEEPKDCWREPLHIMADWESAQVLIDAGADVNALTEDDQTPLHLLLDSPGVARVLIAAGADVNARDKDGRTPLFYTADPRVAKLLVDAGADVNAKDNEGATPLLRNIGVAEKRYLDFMAAAGADFRAKDNSGRTLLHRTDYEDPPLWQIRYLLAKGVDVNAKNGNGDTPLHEAENRATILLLLDAGADLNTLNDQGDPPLNMSTLLDPPMLKRCLAHGLNPNLKLYYGFTLLHEVETVEAAKLLLDAGADINAKTEDGETPIIYALKNPPLLKTLIAAGADLEARGELGRTALFETVDYPEAAKILLAAGAEVDARDEFGQTAFANAIGDPKITRMVYSHREARDEEVAESLKKNLEMAKILLEAGADVNARDEDGRTPLFEAVDFPELVKFLIDAGADVNAVDNDGNRAFDLKEDSEETEDDDDTF